MQLAAILRAFFISMTCSKCDSSNIEIVSYENYIGYYCIDCTFTNYRMLPYGQCCETPNVILLRFEQSNGVLIQRKGCANCKSLIGGNIKRDLNFNTYPLLTNERYIEIEKRRTEDFKAFSQKLTDLRESHQQQKDSKFFKEYSVYLNSLEWKQKRLLVLKRDNYICQGCLINEATQVHHLTYEHVFNEMLFELTSICESCHNKLHADAN